MGDKNSPEERARSVVLPGPAPTEPRFPSPGSRIVGFPENAPGIVIPIVIVSFLHPKPTLEPSEEFKRDPVTGHFLAVR